ncbi:MAG: CDP-alcohol phosphatidyltransferase family protein [Deltaproteobacteria bacterium]|nr:CDP-alcohol phosphatidyltransferase family protein [Deltaproteobacteria bacterium]
MEQTEVLHELHRRALWTGGWHILGLLTISACLLRTWPAEVVLQWLLQAFVVLSYVHFQLFSNLGQNHPPTTRELRPSLGVANGITLARGLGASCLAGFFMLPSKSLLSGASWIQWTPGLLYLSIGCADFVDGFWARHTLTESVLGQRLDVEIDAMGLLAASALAVRMNRLPLFYLMVGASYYLYKLGIRYRYKRGRIVLPLKDRIQARIAAGLNMGFVGVALLPVFAEKVLSPAACFFAMPLIAGFAWDWLVVSARLTDDAAHRMQKILDLAVGIAPLLVRLALLVWGPAVTWTIYKSLPAATALAVLCLWTMMVLGWLGRTAALIAACWLTHAASPGNAPQVLILALSASLVLLILGSGLWSWWKPEDVLLSRKAGSIPCTRRSGPISTK